MTETQGQPAAPAVAQGNTEPPQAGATAPTTAPASTPPEGTSPSTPSTAGLGEGTPASSGEPQPPQQPAVPEKYELAIPEGSQLGQDALDRIAETAKERKLTQEQAQQLVQDESDYAKRSIEAFNETTMRWLEEAKADPDIGGAKFDATMARGNAVLDRFADPEFKQTLIDSGLNRHVGLIRMFNRIGEAMEVDQAARRVVSAPPVPRTPEKTGAQSMFPNSNMNP